MNITSSIRRMVLMNRGMLLHSLYFRNTNSTLIYIWGVVLRNECLFFWVLGVWIVARDKQIAWTAKRFSCDLFVPRYDSYPWTQKKDNHSLYLQCFQQGLFLKFSEKSYLFKTPTVMGTSLHLMYLLLRMWFGPTADLFVDSVHRELNWNFKQGSTKEIWYHCKYLLMNRGKETVPFAAACYGVYWLPNQSDFPPISWPWYRAWLSQIMSSFHGAFATGVACQQGTLTLPDTWFRPPFWDLLVLQLLRPNSSNLPCLYSTFHIEYPLVLSRFCIVKLL